MKRFAIIAAIPVIAVAALTAPTTARAGDGGAVAAGAVGGFIGGLALGSALAPRPYYQPATHCYWTRGRPHWDAWRGVWVRPRIRVCE
jgi:membrane associated rhomboid family serine protease